MYITFYKLLYRAICKGKNPRRRRTPWLKNLRDWFRSSSIELFRAVVCRVCIVVLIANFLREELEEGEEVGVPTYLTESKNPVDK